MPDIRDLREEALHLAVELFSRRPQDDYDEGRAVVRTAGEFTQWLTARAVSMTVGDPVITEESNPAVHVPLNRTGADMAVTMTDTQQATYPAPSEVDSKGYPVTGDTIAIAESSGGAVVAMTEPGDGTVVFAAVAPGSVQVSWTDGTLSFADTINVTAGPAATLTVGEPVIEEQPAPAPPAPEPTPAP